MVAEDYFNHISPNGETPLDRVRASGYIPYPLAGYTIGENIAGEPCTSPRRARSWPPGPPRPSTSRTSCAARTATPRSASSPPLPPASLSGGQAGAVYTQKLGVVAP